MCDCFEKTPADVPGVVLHYQHVLTAPNPKYHDQTMTPPNLTNQHRRVSCTPPMECPVKNSGQPGKSRPAAASAPAVLECTYVAAAMRPAEGIELR